MPILSPWLQLPARASVRRTSAHRGFTLIELMVVFAIMALVVAMAPVAYDRLKEGVQYRDTVRSLITQLRSARYAAVSEGVSVRFTVDLKTREYGVPGAVKEIPESVDLRTIVADREFVPGGSASIVFLASGGSTGGSVEIVRKTGTGTRLRVDWLSGRVTQEPLLQ
ncbi:GspH/FimT family pseudopilin [Comamonas odontotermitis]|uniref:GspH/FimT family pseudopilin n=1 Tax=Comamonas odontotermitis TaxID=379895 RepID=UPI001CC645A1|nr:GspH/FimT family pseudopilin [Comamonas odontotermitis]UBB19279.1 prepilin-type N-terminal cleavage/methylation domain-containing protein [Comamonas odontotermitis]